MCVCSVYVCVYNLIPKVVHKWTYVVHIWVYVVCVCVCVCVCECECM